MGEVNTLITELATDLVDAIETTYDELLKVKLRGDAHEHVHAEVVVESLERLGSGSTGGHVEDRSFNLDETHVVEEGTDVLNHTGSSHKDLTILRIEDEIQVTLTVAGLLVGECPWHHVETWREELHHRREDGELTLLGFAREALDSDDVTTLDESKLVVERLLVASMCGKGVTGGVELLEVAHHLIKQETILRRASKT